MLRILITIWVLAPCILPHAHAQDFLWGQDVGGLYGDQGRSIATDASGNVYVTGYFVDVVDFDPGPGTFNLNSSGGSEDIFLAKYASDGTFLWAIHPEGANNDKGLNVTVDGNGDVILCGFFSGIADFDPSAGDSILGAFGRGGFLAKYDGSGNLIWAQALDAGGLDEATFVTTNASNHIFVSGFFENTVNFNTFGTAVTRTSAGMQDAYFAEYDANGNLVQVLTVGSADLDKGFGIRTGTDGSWYTTGYFSAVCDFDPGAGISNLTSNGLRDVFLAKFTSAGNLVRAQGIGGPGQDEGYAIDVSSGGNEFFVTGYYSNTVDFNPGGGTYNLTSVASSEDVFVAKYDTAGTFSWAFSIGDAPEDYGYSVKAAAGGAVYVAGTIRLALVDFDPGAGEYYLFSNNRDGFLARYDNSGALGWAFLIGAAAEDLCYSVAVDPIGQVYTTGGIRHFNVDLDPGPGSDLHSTTGAGDEDVFFAKYSPCQGPSVTAHPDDDIVCTGGNASFTFSYTGPADSVRWQMSSDSGATWSNIFNGGSYSGTTTTTLTVLSVGAGQNHSLYRAILFTCIGAVAETEPSEILIPTVQTAFSASPVELCRNGSVAFTGSQYALDFDGVNDVLQATSSTAGNFGASDFTIEFWMNTTSSGTERNLLNRRGACACGTWWDIRMTAGGSIRAAVSGDGACAISATITGAALVNNGAWHHVALVREGIQFTLYIDGIADGSATTSSVISFAGADLLKAGGSVCSGMDGSANYSGKLDEIRLWNVAKTGSRLNALKRYYPDGYEYGIQNAWSMNTANSSVAADVKGMADLNLVSMDPLNDYVSHNVGNYTYSYTFGDASSGSGFTTSHTYTTAGAFSISATVTTPEGCTASSSEDVIVQREPYPQFDASPNPACFGDMITMTPRHYSLQLSGVNEGACSAAPFTTAVANVSLEAWVKWNGATAADQYIVYNGNPGTNGYGILLNQADGYDLAIRLGGVTTFATNGALTPGTWHHLALVQNGSRWILSLDGMPVDSTAAVAVAPSGSTCAGKSAGGGAGFNGLLDEVRLWTVARTNSQLTEFKNRSLKNMTVAGLHSILNMDADKGTGLLTDANGSGFMLDLVNVDSIADFIPGGPLGYGYEWFVNDVYRTSSIVLDTNTLTSGVYEIKLKVTDPFGCFAADSFNVVVDTTHPVAVCQNRTLYLDASGNAAVTAAQVDNGSSDNCLVSTIGLSKTAFTCADLGANTVTLTVTDPVSLNDACTATITVFDTLDPLMACQNLTVYLNAAGSAAILALQADAGTSDNCSITGRSVSQSVFTCAHLGVQNETFYATDQSANTDSCAFTVTVLDTTSPLAVCAPFTVYLNGSGAASVTPANVDGGSTDNCSITFRSLDVSSFNCIDMGANPVVLTITDQSGNDSTCVATVTVDDTISPNALCKNITVYLDGAGNAVITSAMVNNTSTDNCTIGGFTLSDNSFTCADTGPNVVTLTVMDVNGNYKSCTSTITVLDTLDANAMCHAAVTIYLDSTGAATLTPAQINNASTDNCSIASMTLSQTAFDCSHLPAPVNVTLTLTDASGNVSACNSLVTTGDTIAMEVVCTGVTLYLDGTGAATLAPAMVDGGVWDNCTVSLSLSQNAFDCTDLGLNSVTLTGTDIEGGTGNCIAGVTVQDTSPPVASCAPFTLFLGGGGTATLSIADVLTGVSDNCSLTDTTLSQTLFDCSDAGSNSVTISVTDGSLNTGTCTSTVMVLETESPAAICKDTLVLYVNASGLVSYNATMLNDGSTDNCGISTFTSDPNVFTCTDAGFNPVMLYVDDFSGNIDSCTSVVEVQDTFPVTAICQNITVYLNGSGSVSIDSSDINGGSTDNCGIVTMGISDNLFTCADTGASAVTLLVTDVNGNTSFCLSTVTVQDSTPPVAACAGITLYLGAGGTVSTTPAAVNAGSSDNCGISSLVLSKTLFTCADTGSNPVTLTVTDQSGNVSSCIANVIVHDTTSPNALCKNITVFLDSMGVVSITAPMVDNGSSDNCALSASSLSITSFGCGDTGPHNVTLTYTDLSGNTDACNSIVTVQDSLDIELVCTSPTVYLDSAGIASIDSADVVGLIWDNCPGVSVTLSADSLDCGDVLYLATDTLDQGQNTRNQSSAEDRYWQSFTAGFSGNLARIRVLDSSAAPVILSVYEGPGTAGALLHTQPGSTAAGWTDFNLTVFVPVVSGSTYTFAVERTSLPLEPNYSDANPYAGGFANLNGFTGASFNLDLAFGIYHSDTVLINDVPVTVTASDGQGNTAVCNAVVQVMDTIHPQITCAPATVYLDAAGQGTISAGVVTAFSWDNCGIDTLLLSKTEFGCGDVGVNAVVLTARDFANNLSSCITSVLVVDSVKPEAVCQNLTLWLDGAGNASLSAAMLNDSSSDACGIASLTAGITVFTCADLGVNPVALTVIDASGNLDSCISFVTILDSLSPVIAGCPSSAVLYADSTDCSPVHTWSEPVISDNCSFSFTSSHASGDEFTAGISTVTYTATDTAGNLTECTFTVEVVPDSLSASLMPGVYAGGYGVSCNGASDGHLTVFPEGGCLPYSYLWSTSSVNDSITGLSAGLYTVTVTDGAGAMFVVSWNLTEPAAVNATPLANNVSCPGANDGSISVTVSGGAPPYFYIWSHGDTAATADSLAAGTYGATVTDAGGCTFLLPPVTLTEDVTPPVAAFGYDTTGAPVVVFSGTSTGFPLDWYWDFGDGDTSTAQNPTHTYAAPGTYIVTLMVLNGCGTDTITDTILVDFILAQNTPNKNAEWVVYPNPNDGIFTLSHATLISDEIRVQVVDVYGHVVQETNGFHSGGAYSKVFDLSGLSKGVYHLRIQHGGGETAAKVIVR